MQDHCHVVEVRSSHAPLNARESKKKTKLYGQGLEITHARPYLPDTLLYSWRTQGRT
jgi:hypothetical protein